MRRWSGRIAHAVCACLGLMLVLTARGAEPPQDPVEAVWKAQRLIFQYHSQGTFYACDILEEKVRRILRQLGARDGLKLRRVACRDLAGTARLEVIMESPVVATAENIRDITDYDSKDELVARMKGVQLPSAGELVRFPAVWERISLRRAPRLHLEDRDCALIQQLRHQVLPKMSIQVISDIDAGDCSHASPRLTVVALVGTL